MLKPAVILTIVLGFSQLVLAETEAVEHEHKMVVIPPHVQIPRLAISLNKDAKSGYNLAIKTQHFLLQPPEQQTCCNGELLAGHAHIYINGEKIYRAYGPYMHLPATLFKAGINQIMVSLNDHDHNTWSDGNKMVMATWVIDTQKEAFFQHSFTSFGFDSP